jgi:hypothetical protein
VNRRLEIASRSPAGMTGTSDAAGDAASNRRGAAAALAVTVNDGWFNGMRVGVTCAPAVPAASAGSARADRLVAAAGAPSAEARIAEAIARFDARLPARIRPALATGAPSPGAPCSVPRRDSSPPAAATAVRGPRAGAGGRTASGGDGARRSTPAGPQAAPAPGHVASADAEPVCQTPAAAAATRMARGRAPRRRPAGDGFLIPLEAMGPTGGPGSLAAVRFQPV